VISALALSLFGLLQADVAENALVDRGGISPPAVVVVALPANAAMREALNRLRGEATSVGFEVRFIETATESVSLAQLDSLARGLASAALVTFAGPDSNARTAHSLDVWFMDRANGKTSVAHLTADEYADAVDRSEVILAVRAVDFIRARMVDTLAGMPAEIERAKPQPDVTRVRRIYLAAGIGVLGGSSGFSPSLAPQIEVGYPLTAWSRISATAFALGTQSHRDDRRWGVSLDPRFVGASLTLLGRAWHRLQPELEVGAGAYWVRVRGEATPPNVGQTVTLASPGAVVALGLAIHILPYLVLDLRGGTLWLQSKVRIYSTEDSYLGSLGRPAWSSSARLGIIF
jgi:hypothetical protein